MLGWVSGVLTLTERVGEFLHVLMQVLVQTLQLSDIPVGNCFKQAFNVKSLTVAARAAQLYISNLPANNNNTVSL